MSKCTLILAAALAGSLTSIVTAGPSVVLIAADRDCTLLENDFGDTANGAGEYFHIGSNAQGNIKRALIHFDIASAVPAGATIEGAQLSLFCSRASSGGLITATVSRVLADWGEGTSNPSGNEGGGAPATANDATWLYRFYVPGGPSPTWTTPGGDFVPASSGFTTIGAPNQFYLFESVQMAADVQGWLDNPAANFGWIIRGQESGTRNARRFESRTSPITSARPELAVFYTENNPCPADLAEPFGVLDLADVQTFIAAFVSGDLLADLAPPAGVLDLADVQAFIASFIAGCP
ncbi:MAG: DNRLRE domain-containing protein [Phycisphaeraceae bacterium]|nr:MAG: DNRLRE domain-containing protein [Phycisphaeraceae bacterium]